MSDGFVMQEYPRRDDGTLDLARIAATLSLDLHLVGERLIDCAAHLSTMRELLPPRGELVDEFKALVQHLAWIENAYNAADERLVQAAWLVDHEHRVPEPLPLARQIEYEVQKATQSSNMQATRSGTDIPAIGNDTGVVTA